MGKAGLQGLNLDIQAVGQSEQLLAQIYSCSPAYWDLIGQYATPPRFVYCSD